MQDSACEHWMGPYLALSRARPDFCSVLLTPVLETLHEVLTAEEEDTDSVDRAFFLMQHAVLAPFDASRVSRLQVRCPPLCQHRPEVLSAGMFVSVTGFPCVSENVCCGLYSRRRVRRNLYAPQQSRWERKKSQRRRKQKRSVTSNSIQVLSLLSLIHI